MAGTCKVVGCARQARTREMCRAHYMRLWRRKALKPMEYRTAFKLRLHLTTAEHMALVILAGTTTGGNMAEAGRRAMHVGLRRLFKGFRAVEPTRAQPRTMPYTPEDTCRRRER